MDLHIGKILTSSHSTQRFPPSSSLQFHEAQFPRACQIELQILQETCPIATCTHMKSQPNRTNRLAQHFFTNTTWSWWAQPGRNTTKGLHWAMLRILIPATAWWPYELSWSCQTMSSNLHGFHGRIAMDSSLDRCINSCCPRLVVPWNCERILKETFWKSQSSLNNGSIISGKGLSIIYKPNKYMMYMWTISKLFAVVLAKLSAPLMLKCFWHQPIVSPWFGLRIIQGWKWDLWQVDLGTARSHVKSGHLEKTP